VIEMVHTLLKLLFKDSIIQRFKGSHSMNQSFTIH